MKDDIEGEEAGEECANLYGTEWHDSDQVQTVVIAFADHAQLFTTANKTHLIFYLILLTDPR
jgi:hypothetical protein